MSIFSKLFRKKSNEDEQQKEQLDEMLDADNDDFPVEDNEYADTEKWAVASIKEENATETDDVNINYRGGLLSPTQKPKEEQYQEILDNISEETIAIIDNALKMYDDLYTVFQYIEEQGINLLTLVALDMTSEEDIAAYQLKQKRQLESTGELQDEEYEQEIAQSQYQQPEAQFQIDSEELDRVSESINTHVTPVVEAEPRSDIFGTSLELLEPVEEVEPTPLPAVEPVEEKSSIFSSSIFGGAVEQETPASEESLQEVPKETALPMPDLPPVASASSFFPKSSLTSNKMLDALMDTDKPKNPTPAPAPVSLPAAQFMADMQPAEEVTPVTETQVETTITEQAPVVGIAEPVVVAETPVEESVQPTECVKEDLNDQPITEKAVPSFMQAMEGVTETPAQEGQATGEDSPIPAKAGTFAGVKMEFEGYEEKTEDDEDKKPNENDVLNGLLALIEKPKSRTTRKPSVVAPSLSDEKVEEKAQQVQKYKRQSTIKDTRIFILWEGLKLPKIEGYQFIAVQTLRDLSNFGLDVNDLLIVTSQIPQGCIDSIDAYLRNIGEEQQPYRIVNFVKKPYDTPYVTATLNALTKEALDTYYENNQIVLEKKNQVSGFGGIADFLTRKGGDK